MGNSAYGVIAKLVWDGEGPVHIPEEMGTPADNQLQGTPGERLSELAGRVCYDSLGRGRSSEEFHKHILEVGHLSVYEHAHLTVYLDATNQTAFPFEVFLNRPGLWVEPTQRGIRLTFNPRAVLDWKQWILPESSRSMSDWVYAVMYHYAQKTWPQIFVENPEHGIPGSSTLASPLSDEEKWVSMFMAGSRGFSHELVRHGDFTAISQRSTRYVDEDGSPWVDHPLVQEVLKETSSEELAILIGQAKTAARAAYAKVADKLQKHLKARGVDKFTARKQARGAARGYLGNALYTELIFSASVGQWKRMLRMRCSAPADAEIRAVFVEVLKELKKSRYQKDFENFELQPSPEGLSEIAVEQPEVPVEK